MDINVNKKYICAIDSSMSNTGVCIFDTKGIPREVFSISTDGKLPAHKRLKIIGDGFLEKRKEYNISTVIFERGFSRHYLSTQAIFKVLGVISYIFYDCEQIFYSPATVKKVVAGNGRSSKDQVFKVVSKMYPQLVFENDDQSDACACGVCHFIKEGIIKNG